MTGKYEAEREEGLMTFVASGREDSVPKELLGPSSSYYWIQIQEAFRLILPPGPGWIHMASETSMLPRRSQVAEERIDVQRYEVGCIGSHL